MADINIRPAREDDLPAIAEINNHYIVNSVVTFMENPLPLDDFARSLKEIEKEGLPYLVAVDAATQTVVGYANAHGFRGTKGAYKYTVEITLYCHPEQTGKGIGSKLLAALLDAMRAPLEHPHLLSDKARERARVVKRVLAVMSVDETAKKGGLALKEFYEGFGFQLRGHMQQVGYKFDRWVDTMYLQISLL